MNNSTNGNTRELTFGEAIRDALAEELRRDPRVFGISIVNRVRQNCIKICVNRNKKE